MSVAQAHKISSKLGNDMTLKTLRATSQSPRSTLYSAAELKGMKFPHMNWIVDGVVPEGLTLLAAKPKIGKSWMCLDIAVAAATGGKAFIDIQVEETPVIYYALEDNKRRMKRRLRKIGAEWPSGLFMDHYLPPLHEDCVEVITRDVKQVKAGLVIIDTYNFVRPPTKGREDNYSTDYKWLGVLQRLASDLRVAIIVVHHTKKAESDDDFDAITGTRGLQAAVDTMLVLNQKNSRVKLSGRGKDVVDEIQLIVEFNRDMCKWKIGEAVDDLDRTPERRQVINVFRGTKDSLTNTEIAEGLGKPYSGVTKMLNEMHRDGQIRKTATGKYRPL